jgi:ATP-dependent DNA helicase RecG
MPVFQQFELSFEARSRLLTVDEIYALKDASWLKLIREDRRVERKPVKIHSRSLSEWFSMWANTAPNGGIIAVGISDAGEIDGIHGTSVNHLNDLERTGDIFCPDGKCEYKRANVTNKDGKPDHLLLFRVFYNDKKVVRTTDGSAFVRRGDSKIKLSEDEIRELQVEKGEVSLEQEDSSLSYPQDFNLKSIGEFVQSVVVKTGLEYSKKIEEVLLAKHLGRRSTGQFVPNKAFALLFAKDICREIPGCKIRFLRFDGIEEGQGEKFNAVKDVWIETTIPNLIADAEKIIDSQLREFSRLGRDGKFATSPEYPKPAWYEAVVNACCHRSFNLKNIPVFVKMFDDRIEV